MTGLGGNRVEKVGVALDFFWQESIHNQRVSIQACGFENASDSGSDLTRDKVMKQRFSHTLDSSNGILLCQRVLGKKHDWDSI